MLLATHYSADESTYLPQRNKRRPSRRPTTVECVGPQTDQLPVLCTDPCILVNIFHDLIANMMVVECFNYIFTPALGKAPANNHFLRGPVRARGTGDA